MNHTNFGLPSDHEDEDDVTSDDIDDLPHEDVADVAAVSDPLFNIASPIQGQQQQQSNNLEDSYFDEFEFDVDQEFEFLDRTELEDSDDDEEGAHGVEGQNL